MRILFRMVQAAPSFRRCADAVRRTGLVSVVDEFLFVTLRKPKVSFVLKSTALSAVIAAVSVGYTANSPSGFAKNAAEPVADAANVVPAPEQLPQIALAPPPPKNLKRLVTVRSGDTFMKLMTGVSVSRSDANSAIRAMRKVYNPREIRPGQTLTAHFAAVGENGEERAFLGLSFSLSIDQIVEVNRTEDGTFEASLVERELDHRVANLGGKIDASLYTAARRSGLPSSVIVDLIRLFSWDVDFQRDIRPGDSFNVLVERAHLKNGKVARWGDVLYADMTVDGRTQRYFRFESKDRRGRTRVGYFDEKGS